jgi:hypothetical protein
MDFLFTGMFWGLIIILLGLSVILNAVFHIHVPLFRIVIGLIVIFFGIRIIAGHSWCSARHRTCATMFNEAEVTMASTDGEYNVIFGRAVIDTAATIKAGKDVRINTVFGASTVKIPKNVPTIVRVETAFGGVKLPDGNKVAFGNFIYRNKACETATDSAKVNTVRMSVVFGGAVVVEE